MKKPKVTIRDDRIFEGEHPNAEAPELQLCLYHWSPNDNRRSIEKVGLVPGRLSLDGLWRPPYVAFADDPYLAWILSGRNHPEIELWDLWMVNVFHATSVDHWEILLDTYASTGRHYRKEYRIYSRIYKRDLIYIGSRLH